MLDFEEIRKEFDDGLTGITVFRSMIKEYLQCKVLELIYRSPFQSRMIFIGGTRLRLLNGFRRFSEDLDFDLSGEYGDADHRDLLDYLSESLRKQNIAAEPDTDKKKGTGGTFTRYLNFPDIMAEMGIKDVPGRKFFLKIDAEKHEYGDYQYKPETQVLNRFDVFVPLRCAPLSFILSTKLCAILERAKGRDFYDIVELLKQTGPDLDYIKKRMEYGRINLKYEGPENYIKAALSALELVDWDDKTREIEKFLFNPAESDKVRLFGEYFSAENLRKWLSAGI